MVKLVSCPHMLLDVVARTHEWYFIHSNLLKGDGHVPHMHSLGWSCKSSLFIQKSTIPHTLHQTTISHTHCIQSTPSSSGSRGVRRMLIMVISSSWLWVSSVRGLSWRLTSDRELMAFKRLTLTSETTQSSLEIGQQNGTLFKIQRNPVNTPWFIK